MKRVLAFVVIAQVWWFCNGAKILAVMPTPSFSHQIFFRPLWKTLAQRGHEVTLITTDPIHNSTLKNLREIDVGIVYDNAEVQLDKMLTTIGHGMKELQFHFNSMINTSKRELAHPEVQELFSNESITFDLLMIENIFPTMLIFKHRFDVPLIGLASVDAQRWMHYAVGNTLHPILYPSSLISATETMSFLSRLKVFTFDILWNLYYQKILVPKIDNAIGEALNKKDLPSVHELQSKVDMIFINANPIFTNKRPWTPATISLAGGLHTTLRTTEVSQDLQAFMDNATQGFIYFSLGSNVKSKLLPKHLLQLFARTFGQLKYKVLWKYENDAMGSIPGNVKLMKWLPQLEVLRHKNIKLFITQGGLQSLEEALLSGVPMITIPFFADQFANSKRIVINKLGVELMHKTLTEELFKDAIKEVLNNRVYASNVNKQRKIISDRPMQPLDTAIWWTEYVLRHKGAQHLKGPVLGFFKYYYLDVLSVLGLCMYLIYSILKFIITRCWSQVKGKKIVAGQFSIINNNSEGAKLIKKTN